MDKEELRQINVTKYKSVGTSDTQIGDDIPEGKVRHVWRIIASADDGSEQNLLLYAGDSNAEREQIGAPRVPDITNTSPLVIGGDIEDPVLTIRPQRDNAGANTYNRLYGKAQTSAINVTVDYYDI